jgi:photosystem II stability/assembly factor-like uncharacterized protein
MKKLIFFLICVSQAALCTARLPVWFEPVGRRFLAHAGGATLTLTETGAIAGAGGFELKGARAGRTQSLQPLAARVNRFTGSDPSRWQTNIPAYGRIRYRDVYDGIDVMYHDSSGLLECDFLLAPHARPGDIRLRFASAVRVNAAGDLEAGPLVLRRLRIYQPIDGHEREVAGRFVVTGGRDASFYVAAYDPSRPLTIDPVIQYSTYFAGAAEADMRAIASDAAGNTYITGLVRSPDFPTVSPLHVSEGIYVLKLDASGGNLVYATYFGGMAGGDLVTGIAVDRDGNAYLCGSTGSADFPLAGGFQRTLKSSGYGARDAFILKLDAGGSRIVYSSFLGGGAFDEAAAVAVDAQGSAYVTGRTESIDFPVTPGVLGRFLTGSQVAFVTRIAPDGSALRYSTYLGGSGFDRGLGIAVDASGAALVLVYSFSSDFPRLNLTTALHQPVTLVAKLNASATAAVYATSIGERSLAKALAVDASGNAWVAGETSSVHLPVTSGAAQSAPGGDTYFRSTDAGRTFTTTRRGLTASAVNALVTHPTQRSTIYAGTTEGFLRSTDNGATWTGSNRGLTSTDVAALAIDLQDPRTIYLATELGPSLFKSTDAGATWTQIAEDLGDDLGVTALAIDPGNSSTVYAAGPGVLKSTDGGATFGSAAALPAAVRALAVDPANSNMVYAGTELAGSDSGLYRSDDGGLTFTATTVTSDGIYGIVFDPDSPGTIYAAGVKAVYKSADSGQSWTPLDTGAQGPDARALAFDPAQAGILYVLLGTGRMLRSNNGGATFTAVGGDLQIANPAALVFSASSTAHIGAVMGQDAFVMKLAPTGAVIYGSYLGGKLNDGASGIVVDGPGNVYIAGFTTSADCPARAALQAGLAGSSDALLAKLDNSGAVIYSTWLGGAGADSATMLAVDAAGNVVVAGLTDSQDFPQAKAIQGRVRAGLDTFVVKLSQ